MKSFSILQGVMEGLTAESDGDSNKSDSANNFGAGYDADTGNVSSSESEGGADFSTIKKPKVNKPKPYTESVKRELDAYQDQLNNHNEALLKNNLSKREKAEDVSWVEFCCPCIFRKERDPSETWKKKVKQNNVKNQKIER